MRWKVSVAASGEEGCREGSEEEEEGRGRYQRQRGTSIDQEVNKEEDRYRV